MTTRTTETSGKGHAPRAKKSLGQHFLRREDICHRIAALIAPCTHDRIVEIGPGPGALTRAIEAAPHARLLLIEKDRHWAAERQRLGGANTQAVLADALRFDWRRISPQEPWKVIGNLPYNVASPLIWDIVSLSEGWQMAAFMVQKEVGQRLAAQPDTGHYGALSVWVQSYARPRMEFVVGPGAFSPPPKVDSAVLSFTPLPLSERPAHPALLSRLLRICFQQRRKQLGGIFRRAAQPGLEDAFKSTQIAPDLRPEVLSHHDFQRISAFWASQLDNMA
ncbi:16S rRNA (adenine(1518)-N(6)/adenine(1519)-N(6))-dimethyltransferase RsmA [Desulfovibrio sp.]|uniref:16S rRNA (adenine(1518)-N(6)/adenine(1519)-N(6))- dimethyltransferase RsmA n=1 Tax=Desulfovibrio sp. TaxID=885 RepID=UPI003D0D8478